MSDRSHRSRSPQRQSDMKIQVHLQSGPSIEVGKTITLDVNPSDTLDQVKLQIQDKEGIATAEQSLSYLAMGLAFDTRALSDYQIRDKSELYLHQKFRVYPALLSGRRIPPDGVEVTHGTRVIALKEDIALIEHIALEWICLECDGTLLLDWDPLYRYSIQKNQELTLVISEPTHKIIVRIIYQDRSEQKITLEVKASNTFDDVRAMIRQLEGIPVKCQSLMLPNRRMMMTDTLRSSVWPITDEIPLVCHVSPDYDAAWA